MDFQQNQEIRQMYKFLDYLDDRSLGLLCREQNKCQDIRCYKLHPQIFSGVCIEGLQQNEPYCSKSNCQLRHFDLKSLKKEEKIGPINGKYRYNLCPKVNCYNKINCQYLHPFWAKDLCIPYLNDKCEEYQQHDNLKHIEWGELRDKIHEQTSVGIVNPENLCLKLSGNCAYHLPNINNICFQYFKGLCPNLQCLKEHVCWEEFQFSQKQNEQKQLVLIGECGCGKTTLFNRITQSQQQISYSVYVASKLMTYGLTKINVIKIPGLVHQYCKTDQAAQFIAALTDCPVQRIILVLKCQRICMMQQSLSFAIRHIQPYQHLVTVVVTFWDLLDESERENKEQQIRLAFLKQKISSVIFTSEKESRNQTCEKILQEIVNSNAEQINMTLDMLVQNFELNQMTEEQEHQLFYIKSELKKQAKKKVLAYEVIIKEFSMNYSRVEDFEILFNELKKQLDESLTEFEKENYMFFSQLELFATTIVYEQLKNVIEIQLIALIENIKKELIKKGETDFTKFIGKEKIKRMFEYSQNYKIEQEKYKEQFFLKIQEIVKKYRQEIIRL